LREDIVRRELLFVSLVAAIFTPTLSRAQNAAESYPSRQVRIVVPYPPGGPTDLIGRILG
jgi:tripartite-type tricarboxylate transporter receptor subunit TctC